MQHLRLMYIQFPSCLCMGCSLIVPLIALKIIPMGVDEKSPVGQMRAVVPRKTLK